MLKTAINFILLNLSENEKFFYLNQTEIVMIFVRYVRAIDSVESKR